MAGLKLGKEMRDGRVWMKTEAIAGWTDKKRSPSLGLRQTEYASAAQATMAVVPGEKRSRSASGNTPTGDVAKGAEVPTWRVWLRLKSWSAFFRCRGSE